MNDSIIVTGGAGFIGSNFVLDWIIGEQGKGKIVTFDKLTYAGHRQNLAALDHHPAHEFVKGDICDRAAVREVLSSHRPRGIIHFAAESHVDRSIAGPEDFMQTNVVGTFHLLEEVRGYWNDLSGSEKRDFRFLHVSTDEVYGSLGPKDPAFQEHFPYRPNSPYSASKAASDHLVRAYHHTYALPTLTTNSSNNYGPYQTPEKLIPLVIHNALEGKALPLYGDGLNSRDWLYVGDHCAAIRLVFDQGEPGDTYHIGGNAERTNLEVVTMICRLLDELSPHASLPSYTALITFVKDRPGHDRRYAMNCDKLHQTCGWMPVETFESGLRRTIEWYLAHEEWVKDVVHGEEHQRWMRAHYSNREGT